jgi:hypothetical protein
MALSQVSKTWRELAISLASLWATIDIFATTQLSMPRLYASRSGTLPLQFTVNLHPGTLDGLAEHVRETAEFIFMNLDRVDCLSVRADQLEHLSSFLTVFRDGNAPNMTSLRILLDMDGTYPFMGDSDISIRSGGSARLQTFICRGLSPVFCAPSLASLTRLHLLDIYNDMKMEFEDYIDIIQELTQLAHLAIHGSIVHDIESAFGQRAIELANLRSLQLIGTDASGAECVQIMRTIAAPSLSTLTLEHATQAAFHEFERILESELLRGWLGFPDLDKLVLSNCISSSDHYRRCFRTFPSTRHLTIMGGFSSAAADALGGLDEEATPLLPQLSTLTLPASIGTKELQSLVAGRRAVGWPLQLLRLSGNWTDTKEDLDNIRDDQPVELIGEMHDPLISLEDLLEAYPVHG